MDKKVSQLGNIDLESKVIDWLSEANKRSSTKANNEVLDQAKSDLIRELNGRHSNFTVSEVDEAIYSGSIGEYGEFFGVNSKNVINWLKTYRKVSGIESDKEIEKTRENVSNHTQEINSERLKKEFHEKIVKMFETYKKNGVSMTGIHSDKWVVYKYLTNDVGIDLIPTDEKKVIFENAKEKHLREVESEIEKSRMTGDRERFRDLVNLKSSEDPVKVIAMGDSLERLLELMKQNNVKL